MRRCPASTRVPSGTILSQLHANVLMIITGAECLTRVPCIPCAECLCKSGPSAGTEHVSLRHASALSIMPACCIAQEVRAAGVGAAYSGGQGADRGGAVRPRDGAPPVRMNPRNFACCAVRFATVSLSAASVRADSMTSRVPAPTLVCLECSAGLAVNIACSDMLDRPHCRPRQPASTAPSRPAPAPPGVKFAAQPLPPAPVGEAPWHHTTKARTG